MASPRKGTYRVNLEVLERLRAAHGLTIEELAERSLCDKRTLERLAAGQPGYLRTLDRLAKALGVPTAKLIAPVQTDDVASLSLDDAPQPFEYQLHLKGLTDTPAQRGQLVRLTPDILRSLRAAGITLTEVSAKSAAGQIDFAMVRLMVCIWLILENKEFGWVIIAVRFERIASFSLAEATGTLDVNDIDHYGEVVVSGDGPLPPFDVIEKVERIYRMKPGYFRTRIINNLPADRYDAAFGRNTDKRDLLQ